MVRKEVLDLYRQGVVQAEWFPLHNPQPELSNNDHILMQIISLGWRISFEGVIHSSTCLHHASCLFLMDTSDSAFSNSTSGMLHTFYSHEVPECVGFSFALAAILWVDWCCMNGSTPAVASASVEEAYPGSLLGFYNDLCGLFPGIATIREVRTRAFTCNSIGCALEVEVSPLNIMSRSQ